MQPLTEIERDVAGHCNGLFVGLLSDAETTAFDSLIEKGLAERSYEGAGGFMGLAKVRINSGAVAVFDRLTSE